MTFVAFVFSFCALQVALANGTINDSWRLKGTRSDGDREEKGVSKELLPEQPNVIRFH